MNLLKKSSPKFSNLLKRISRVSQSWTQKSKNSQNLKISQNTDYLENFGNLENSLESSLENSLGPATVKLVTDVPKILKISRVRAGNPLKLQKASKQKHIDEFYHKSISLEKSLSGYRRRLDWYTPGKPKIGSKIGVKKAANRYREQAQTCRERKLVLNKYIGSQPMTPAKEVVVPSLQTFKTDNKLFKDLRVDVKKDLTKIETKHHQDGIMRRNKLLIEHILYQRYRNKLRLIKNIKD